MKTSAGVWNRACLSSAPAFLQGDQALAAMLTFHSVAMNGGVLHGLEVLSPAKLAAAADGFRFFGLSEVAQFLRETSAKLQGGVDSEALERELDARYSQIAGDDVLMAHFEASFLARPGDFAPL